MAVVERLRQVCLGLPETYEEDAWIGARWRVRGKTFAHVLVIDGGRPAAYAEALGRDGPVCVLTFQSPEIDALRGERFFHARWGREIAGLVIEDDPDWDEIEELLTESYVLLAPRKLAEQVGR